MSTSPSPNDLTRQQLDELDSLLQRMLSLPLTGPVAAANDSTRGAGGAAVAGRPDTASASAAGPATAAQARPRKRLVSIVSIDPLFL